MAKAAPIEVPWRARDGLAVFAMSWVGAPLILVLAIGLLAGAFPALAGFARDLQNGDITASFVFVVVDGLAALALVRWYLRRHGLGWSAVGWRRFNPWRAALYIVAIYAIFLIAVAAAYALVSVLYPAFNADQAQINEFTRPGSSQARQLSFLALVILPPILEETVFRGFVFPALARRGGPVLGALATSLLFGVAHWQLNIGIYTLVLSLLLCMMYWKLRSIWPGVIFHMLNNYLAYMALLHK